MPVKHCEKPAPRSKRPILALAAFEDKFDTGLIFALPA